MIDYGRFMDILGEAIRSDPKDKRLSITPSQDYRVPVKPKPTIDAEWHRACPDCGGATSWTCDTMPDEDRICNCEPKTKDKTMKIKYKGIGPGGEFRRIDSISDYVSLALDGGDYDRGELETIRATADNTATALSRLVELLATKGTLTASEIVYLAGTYDPDACFVD